MAKRRDDGEDWVDEDYDDIERDGAGDDGEFDATEHDEADQKRFASDIAYCPECGAEVLDDADICPKCFTWIDGATHRKPSKLRRSFRVGVVILLLLAATVGGVWVWFLMVLN